MWTHGAAMSGSPVTGFGIGEAVRQAVPPGLLPAVVAVTHLGNVAVLLALFTLDYWFGDHERGAPALGLALAGMALVTVLKVVFAEPRPPERLRVVATGGFSFPSGHAPIATIGYGVLAFDLELGTRRARYAAAGVLVGLVALSRVVLGVHFLRDVVAGVLVGVAFLVAAERFTGHDPRLGFLLAAALGVSALLVSGASGDSVTELGAILGAATAWLAVDAIPSVESIREHLLLLGAGLPAFAGVSYLSLFADLAPVAAFLLNAALLAGVVLAPLPVARFVRDPPDGPTGDAGAR